MKLSGDAVMGFWDLRRSTYRDVLSDGRARGLLLWDIARVAIGGAGFFVGLCVHAPMIVSDWGGRQFMGSLCTFSTFLASFVLAVMANGGKREMDLVRDAAAARRMRDRLSWLLSDQLVMVVSALATAGCGLTWLVLDAANLHAQVLTAAAAGFGAMSLVNALRLPIQIWELQSTAIDDARDRAFKRLNAETAKVFDDIK